MTQSDTVQQNVMLVKWLVCFSYQQMPWKDILISKLHVKKYTQTDVMNQTIRLANTFLQYNEESRLLLICCLIHILASVSNTNSPHKNLLFDVQICPKPVLIIGVSESEKI